MTNTHIALEYARGVAFQPVKGGRPSATKVVIVVTDGNSTNERRSEVKKIHPPSRSLRHTVVIAFL